MGEVLVFMNGSLWRLTFSYTAIFRTGGFCRVDLRQVRSPLLDAGREGGSIAICRFQFVDQPETFARRPLERIAAAALT
ncbi:hypothetical protein [Burkholderia anthina]|uniref:hypothetical protein n=1 Tax=Burkholderia anthina TaxID=179879 RepID=UPI001AA090C5|nr:hypothetical protein [Burkholderia anthina]QTD93017.1 hypothetical protein J4G50_19180 [Burkholderia anthina]